MAAAFTFILNLMAVVVISSPELIPTNQGTTWHYSMIEEAGPGVRLSDSTKREAGTLHAEVVYRIKGTQEVDGRNLLQFEMHRGGQVTNTDLLAVDETGVRCWARIDDTGELIRLNPAQPIVDSPLTVGHTWDFDTLSNGDKVHQHYEIIGQGDIVTPAGKFRAIHIRCKQDSPGPMTIDRWFANGIGIVKDVTETRSDTGELLRRITLELTEQPRVTDPPDSKVRPNASKLKVTLGQEAVGETRTSFLSIAPKICARWQGHGLRPHSKIRALWIAESVDGVAPPDYTIDEATTIATASDSHGVFTLGRPEEGWAPGIYRVEVYVDSGFEASARLKIVRPGAAAFGH